MRHIDLENDILIPVSEIYKARTGKRLNPATKWRWIKGKGCSGVKLEAVPVNGAWYSTPHAFAMFLQEQTDARLAEPAAAEESLRDERKTQKLQAAGLLK